MGAQRLGAVIGQESLVNGAGLMKRLDDGTGRSADSADQTDFKSQIQNHQSQMGAKRLGRSLVNRLD